MLFVLQPEIKIMLNILTGLFSNTSYIRTYSSNSSGETTITHVSLIHLKWRVHAEKHCNKATVCICNYMLKKETIYCTIN